MFVESGMEHPRVRSQVWEDWKPAGTYFSPNLKSAAELVPGGGGISPKDALRGNWEFIGETVDTVRGVLKSNRVLEVTKDKLLDLWNKFVGARGIKSKEPGGWPFSTASEMTKAHKDWSRTLGNKFDAVVVKNVDGREGATEVIAMNPKAVKLFHKDLKWPMVAGATTAGAMMATGTEEAQAANPDNFVSPSELMADPTKPVANWVSPTQLEKPNVAGWTKPSQLTATTEAPPIPPQSPTEDVPTMSPVDYELMSPDQQFNLLKKQTNKKEISLVANLALMALSSGFGGGLTKLAINKLGWPLGKLALATLESMGAGAVYEAARGAMGLEPRTIPFTDIQAPGVETLEWAGFPGAGKVVGKTLKGVGKGVDWMGKKVVPEAVSEIGGKVADVLWDNILIKPTTWELPGFKKSIREMFQPAVERLAQSKTSMERMVASTFRKGEAMKSLSTEAGRQLGKDLEGLLPSEQYEVMKGLRGTELKDITSPKAKDVLWKLEQKLKEADLNQVYDIKFRENLSTLLTKPIEEVEGTIGSESISKMLKTFEAKLPQKASVSAVYDMLKEIIEHPHISEEAKVMAKELWSMPAKTPLDVADATRKAGTYYLMDKLTAYKGLVSAVPKEGYVKSEWGRLAGQYIPRDVELELQTIAKVPQIARGFYQKWFLSPWKVSKTITRPAYHIRNLVSNAILNDWGGLPFYRVDVYMDALKSMRNNDAMWKDYRRMTGAGGTFVQRDLYQLEAGMKYGASMSDKLYNVYERAIQPMTGIQQAEENLFKFAKYRYNILEQGMKPAESALDAQKWIFNFGEITPEIAQVRKYGMPFFTWYAKAIPLAAETAVKHPVRFWKWVAFGMEMQQQALQAVGISDGEWDSLKAKLPDYMQKGMYLMLPWRDDKRRLNMLNLTYIIPGIGDINEFYQRSVPEMIIQNPLVTLAGTIISKKKFSGAPLYYDWEPATVQASKTFAYMWEQLSPAIAPGGTDWNSIYRSVTEQENAPSPEQAVSGFFGFKVTPVDAAITARRSAAIQKIHESEMAMEMQRELRKARTADEVSSIQKKYQAIRKSIVQP